MTALHRARPLAVSLAALALGLSACGGGDAAGGAQGSSAGSSGASSAPAGEVVAVATTTQLGSVLSDVVQCHGGSSATLMGPGDDPHDVSPSSAQVAEMVKAGLVFTNGLGLEGGMASALENARRDGAELVEVAPQLDPLPFGAAGEDAAGHEGESTEEHAAHAHEGHEGHDHGSEDPHVWMDVARMARAAAVMGDALAERTGDDGYGECGRQVQGELEQTDREVREILAAVPEDRRTLVTDHDAYGYFGAAYGFDVAGVVIPGGSTDAEPSSQELAALTAAVREAGADALLTSVSAGQGLVDAVATEAGGLPVVKLYESGVGPADTPEADYAAAMLHNAHTLADALGG